MLRGGGGRRTPAAAQPFFLLLGDAFGGHDDDLMLGLAMDGMTCFMVALVTLMLSCPGPPWCIARHLVLWTGLPVLLPLLLSLPASLASPLAGKGSPWLMLPGAGITSGLLWGSRRPASVSSGHLTAFPGYAADSQLLL